MLVNTRFVLPENLRQEIVDFASVSASAPHFFENTTAGVSGKRVCFLNHYNFGISEKIRQFSSHCFSQLGINYIIKEPQFGNSIGVHYQEGTFVHPHMDAKGPNREWHIRINFLVQKPEQGGTPIIDGQVYNVEEGCSWINYACTWLHSSTTYYGQRNRISLTLGSHVEYNKGLEILERIYNNEIRYVN